MPNPTPQGILDPLSPSPDWLLELINSLISAPPSLTVTDASSANVALPAATGSQTAFVVKNSAGFSPFTITPNGSDTIDGIAGPQTSFNGHSIARSDTAIVFFDNAAGQWLIIATYFA